MAILIKGGPAGSGRKAHYGMQKVPTQPWTCPRCEHVNKGSWSNCFGSGCNERRPADAS